MSRRRRRRDRARSRRLVGDDAARRRPREAAGAGGSERRHGRSRRSSRRFHETSPTVAPPPRQWTVAAQDHFTLVPFVAIAVSARCCCVRSKPPNLVFLFGVESLRHADFRHVLCICMKLIRGQNRLRGVSRKLHFRMIFKSTWRYRWLISYDWHSSKILIIHFYENVSLLLNMVKISIEYRWSNEHVKPLNIAVTIATLVTLAKEVFST